jgi:hypothetical protein
MSAEVLVLPGVERRDLGGDLTDQEVLASTASEGITDIIVIGRRRDGSLYVASANGDADRVVGQLMRAVQFMAAATFAGGYPAEDESDGAA